MYCKRCTRIILLYAYIDIPKAQYIFIDLERERPIDFVYTCSCAYLYIYTYYIPISQPGDFIHSGRVPRCVYYIYTQWRRRRGCKRGEKQFLRSYKNAFSGIIRIEGRTLCSVTTVFLLPWIYSLMGTIYVYIYNEGNTWLRSSRVAAGACDRIFLKISKGHCR